MEEHNVKSYSLYLSFQMFVREKGLNSGYISEWRKPD